MKRIISAICVGAMFLGSLILTPTTALADAPTLKTDSELILTKDRSAVCGTGGTITAETLAAEFEGSVTVKNPDGTVLEGTKKVPTGSTVVQGDSFIPVIVSGDANADGNINLGDVSAIMKKIARWDISIDETASLVSGGAKLSLADVSTVLKFIAGWDIRLGNMKVVVIETPVKATNEDGSTSIWTNHSTAKQNREDLTSTGEFTYVINAAKNEIEGATVYIAPTEEKKDVTISVTDFVNCYGDNVKTDAFIFHYIRMGDNGYLPDPAMPDHSNYAPNVKANNSHGFLVNATTTADTVPGLYEATLSIKSEGVEFKRVKLYLNVWDFTLDDSDAPRSAFGLGKSTIANLHGINGSTHPEEYNDLYRRYYDFLLENRICCYILPYNVEDEAADRYLNDPRVNSFAVYGRGYGGIMDCTTNQLVRRYEKLKGNSEWFDKAYFYMVDEPYDGKNHSEISQGAQGCFADMRSAKEFIEKYFPGGKSMIPLETGRHITLYDGFMDLYKETCDIYCPKTYAFTPTKYFGGGDEIWEFNNEEILREYGSYANFAAQGVTEGKESWWYFAGLPAEPYSTYHATADGMYVRMSGWQMFRENVTGVLYYLMDDYRSNNPLHVIDYMTGVGVAAYGNGILVYPGARYGIDGPIGSVRIDYIRDSFEDYMYLTMAERLIGEEATNEILLKVTRDLLDFETDAAVMQAVRAELAKSIMAAQEK